MPQISVVPSLPFATNRSGNPPRAVMISLASASSSLHTIAPSAADRSSVTGAVGLLDRVAALCFAAPVFFHSVRWYFQWRG